MGGFTSLWIDGFKNNLTQLLTPVRRTVAWNNHIYTLEVDGIHRGQWSKSVKCMFVRETPENHSAATYF